ncbi:MAG: S8 family serine peptidase [Candidatus Caldatribacteriota bacterium]
MNKNIKRILSFLLAIIVLTPCSSFAIERQEFILELTNINYAHEIGMTGKKIKVAIIDTNFTNLSKPNVKQMIFTPSCGDKITNHGDTTAQVFKDIAKDADVYAITCGGEWQATIEGLEWCLENNIQVINMSIGAEYLNEKYTKQMQDVLNKLDKKGAIIIASAGNYQIDTYYPALLDNVYSVSGIDCKDNILTKSNFNLNNANWIDFVFLSDFVKVFDINGNMNVVSGTSCAAPAIAGMFALLKQQYPNTNKEELYNMVIENGIKINGVNGILPVYPELNKNDFIEMSKKLFKLICKYLIK